jgi:hypothetical protein
MSISSIGSGAANINMGVISRPVGQNGDVDNDHDNGRRAHGKHDSFRSDFRSLMEAVQSGDMTGAQSALAAIKTDVGAANATYSPPSVPPAAATQTVDPTTSSTPTDPASASDAASSSAAAPASSVGSDLKALFDAVGSGDASSAQAALTQFVTDRQAAWQGAQSDSSNSQGQRGQSGEQVSGHHHGHRHHGLESVIASLFSSVASTTTAPPPTDSTTPTDSSTSTSSDPSSTPATTAA